MKRKKNQPRKKVNEKTVNGNCSHLIIMIFCSVFALHFAIYSLKVNTIQLMWQWIIQYHLVCVRPNFKRFAALAICNALCTLHRTTCSDAIFKPTEYQIFSKRLYRFSWINLRLMRPIVNIMSTEIVSLTCRVCIR